VATANHSDASFLTDLRFTTGMEIIPEYVAAQDLTIAIDAAYLGSGEALSESLQRVKQKVSTKASNQESVELLEQQQDNPVPALLHSILARGASKQASDIHLDYRNKSLKVRYRINGLLRNEPTLALESESALDIFRRTKILANLDTTKSHLPQDGGFVFKTRGFNFRVRASFVPQLNGEKLVLRLLDNNTVDPGSFDIYHTLGIIGLSVEQQKLFLTYLGAESGVILLSGPTGSGKSTLLYAALRHLNTEWRNVITIEDPVERCLPGLTQIEVQKARNLDYPQLLPFVLRQDPDAVMIGEIRDQHTAKIALEASITGHLVLSTVHARSCLEIIPRLMELNVNQTLLAAACRLLVSQRLLPANCSGCLRSIKANATLIKIFQIAADTILYHSVGCNECDQTGIGGRKSVFEFLPITEHLARTLIRDPNSFEQEAYQLGYSPLRNSIRQALIDSAISPAIALRAIGIAPEVVGY